MEVKNEDTPSRPTRRRLKTSRYEFSFLENEEQRLIQQALKISKKDTKRVIIDHPEAPVFYPTFEQFQDPIEFISSIREKAEPFGICKIVPPSEWKPNCQINFQNPMKVPTKKQNIHSLQEGLGFDDGRKFTIQEYKNMADQFYKNWIDKYHNGNPNISLDELAKDYWDIVETGSKKAVVEYANDIDTQKYSSGFPCLHNPKNLPLSPKPDSDLPFKPDPETKESFTLDHSFYEKTAWNLTNLPKSEGSALKFVESPISGITVPWLYIGMLFASFCWHIEDNNFYSMNYSHFGAVKQWYGVPGSASAKFEKVAKDFLLGSFRESPDLLHHMTTQVSPSLLAANGVPVYKVTQEPGCFIITFPSAFHAGFSYGFNCGEAVNFASLDWLKAGGEAEKRYRIYGRESVFSHQRLLFTLLKNHESLPKKTCLATLGQEALNVIEEEIEARPILKEYGVRDLSSIISLVPNDFSKFCRKAADFDDLRSCCICKTYCIFSAIACECDKSKVACTRHFTSMCKCPKDRRFMLSWASLENLEEIRKDAKNLIKTAQNLEI